MLRSFAPACRFYQGHQNRTLHRIRVARFNENAAEGSQASSRSSVDENEMRFFNDIKDWWDPLGSMRALHSYNYERIKFMRKIYKEHRVQAPSLFNHFKPFSELKILDVGCGGGLLCESMTRLGGIVTGIDANENSISIANYHKNKDPSLNELRYQNIRLEEIKASKENTFDIVTSMEVLEHVTDPFDFVKNISVIAKREGFIFLSTINRTTMSYLQLIVAAEYITRIVPVGTHNWNKFLSPDELANICSSVGLKVIDYQGYSYNPFSNSMSPTHSVDANYLFACRKEQYWTNFQEQTCYYVARQIIWFRVV
eukprot:TRINITY_DN2066_c0_g1_i4.p1 TRINITY_DN2066_c0_g1~~TRINITY_DN2066_c0_g1_i4.p1  ORF type:complete len:312 (-),score=26.79 TRINITY_DN2066_c0_g1_i4:912-1847(-)